MGRAMMGAATAPTGFQAPEPYVPESAKAAGALYEAGLAPSVINALQQATTGPIPRPGLEGPDIDFSQYEPGFRDYVQKNNLGGGGKMMMTLPGGLKLYNTGEIDAFSDYMNSIGAGNYYSQYNQSLPGAVTGFGTPTPAPASVAAAAEPAPFDPVAYRNQFKPDSGGLASVAQPAPMEPVNLTEAVPTVVQPQTQQMPNFYQQPMGMMPFGMGGFNPMGYGPMGMFMNPYGGLGGISYNFMNRPMPLYGQGGQFTAGQYQTPEPIKNPMVNAASSFIGGFGFY